MKKIATTLFFLLLYNLSFCQIDYNDYPFKNKNIEQYDSIIVISYELDSLNIYQSSFYTKYLCSNGLVVKTEGIKNDSVLYAIDYSFNKTKQLIEEKKLYRSPITQELELQSHYKFQYENDKIVYKKTLNEKEEEEYKTIYKYNKEGKIMAIYRQFLLNDATYHKDGSLATISRIPIRNNELDKIIEYEYYEDSLRINYFRNFPDKKDILWKYETYIIKNEQFKERKTFNKHDKLYEHLIYSYDEAGNLIDTKNLIENDISDLIDQDIILFQLLKSTRVIENNLIIEVSNIYLIVNENFSRQDDKYFSKEEYFYY